jgi:hypothetical protein
VISAGLVLPLTLGGPFGVYSSNPAFIGAFGQSNGVEADLSGNELAGGMQLIPTLDYYWRDSFYAHIFNRPSGKKKRAQHSWCYARLHPRWLRGMLTIVVST